MVTIEKGREILEKEKKAQFEGLISRIFGPHNLEVSVFRGDYGYSRLDYINWQLSRKQSLNPLQKLRQSWSMGCPETLIKISPGVTENGLAPKIFKDGNWRPINIQVYDPELYSAGIQFAEEYENLSGQETRVLREY